MIESNPYQPPESGVSAQQGRTDANDRVAKAQKLVLYSVLIYILSVAVSLVLPILSLAMILVAFIIAVIGVYRLAGALGRSIFARIFLLIGMIIPLVNLLILLSLSNMANKRLKAAGYRVGLMGASLKP